MEYREGGSRFAEGFAEWNAKLELSSRDRISEFALIPSGRLTIVRATWAGAICIAGCHVASWLANSIAMLLDSRQYLSRRQRRAKGGIRMQRCWMSQNDTKSRVGREALFY